MDRYIVALLSHRKVKTMGGINHQPCGAYLQESTRASLELTQACAHMCMANVRLEDLILAELSAKRGRLEPIIGELILSERHLAALDGVLIELHHKMERLGYRDLAPLATLDVGTFAKQLAENQMAECPDIELMGQMMKDGTFAANIRHFRQRIAQLRDSSRILRHQFEGLKSAVKAKRLHIVAERNEDGNFRVAFARLFTAWLKFQREFLASALVSTEVFYHDTQVGTLIPRSADVVMS